MSYKLKTDGTIEGSSAGAVNTDDFAKVSVNDTTTDYLTNKITAGDFLTKTILNPSSNESIDFDVTGAPASGVTYTPTTLSDWDSSIDPGNADDAFDQLASRLKTLETTVGPTPDSSAITYTPNTLTDWDSNLDPGNVDGALDQLAERVDDLENAPNDASGVTYTPTVLTDWDGDIDPGNVDDALDQLAERVDDLETVGGPSPDASAVTYTPSTLGNWTGSSDPGNVNGALDQLALRVKVLETSNPDASNVTFSPTTLFHWDSSADPGNTDDALNQLAERVYTLESSGVAPVVAVSATDTTPSYLLSKVVSGSRITITRLNAGSNETLSVAADPQSADIITYIPNDLTDWNSNADPGNTDDALDQLAARMVAVEAASGAAPDASEITYTPNTLSDWTGSVDPGDVDQALDQLAARVDTLESAVIDASVVTYTPSVLANWNSSSDPGNTDDALDQLADRVKTLEGTSGDASLLTYTPTVLTDWTGSADPGNTDDALDQLASRIKVIESAPANDASTITYTPTVLTDWNSDTDPGNVDDALDQLAERVDNIENTTTDASVVTFTPNDVNDWTGNVDPGDVNDALDQLASRTDALEIAVTDAADVTYTPNTLSDWNSSSDPGDTDNALDQLAARVKTLESGGGGGDASAISYTPLTLSDWTGSADPGNTDDALDQLASRVTTLESATGDASGITYTPNTLSDWNGSLDPGNTDDALDQLAARVEVLEVSGGGGAVGFVAVDTTIDTALTIPADHQMIVVDGVTIETGGSLTINGSLEVIDSEPEVASENTTYEPNDLTDWNSNVDPGNVNDALDQLADRVDTIEINGAGTVLYTLYDVFAPPASANANDDEFDDNTVTGWTSFDHASNGITITEDSQGLRMVSTTSGLNQFMGAYKSLPAGDFTIDTYMSWHTIDVNGTSVGLALFEDATSAAGDIAIVGFQSGATSYIVVQIFTSYTDSAPTQTAFIEVSRTGGFLRFRRTSTTYSAAFSTDGQGWINIDDSLALGFTPQHVGFVMRKTNGATANFELRSRFFRYRASNVGAYAAVAGQTRNVLA